jgi:hypothetical protein
VFALVGLLLQAVDNLKQKSWIRDPCGDKAAAIGSASGLLRFVRSGDATSGDAG